MPKTTMLNITLPNGRRLAVETSKKRVRNLNLRVRRDGSVAMTVPYGCPMAYAQGFLLRNAAFIERRLREVEAKQKQMNGMAVAGSTPAGANAAVALWGKPVRAADIWGAKAAKFTQAQLSKATTELYRREVKRALPAIAAKYEAAVGRAAASWQVRSMASRWGSCTPAKRSIRIALQLAAYPPECLDAVACHELVHLVEPSHNKRFHMLLDCYCPHNRAAQRRLKKPPLG